LSYEGTHEILFYENQHLSNIRTIFVTTQAALTWCTRARRDRPFTNKRRYSWNYLCQKLCFLQKAE